ncbi:hypothetical protein [Nocardia tengchongensis]|uniref:hypothetical protein n=1 Tax=Nocardia tengchongensis TaxID=2055889 RepID=UPI00367AC4FB
MRPTISTGGVVKMSTFDDPVVGWADEPLVLTGETVVGAAVAAVEWAAARPVKSTAAASVPRSFVRVSIADTEVP